MNVAIKAETLICSALKLLHAIFFLLYIGTYLTQHWGTL